MADIDKIIQDNMGLVYKQLHRFQLIRDDDAFSFAMEALMNAVQTFDADKNVQFSTYATVCIYNAIGRYVRSCNKKRKLIITSYNALVEGNGDAVELEYFLTNTLDNPENKVLARERMQYIRKVLIEERDKLSDNGKKVVGLWIASEFKLTQNEIAKETGISQSNVSRILSVFKYKLRKRLEDFLC